MNASKELRNIVISNPANNIENKIMSTNFISIFRKQCKAEDRIIKDSLLDVYAKYSYTENDESKHE